MKRKSEDIIIRKTENTLNKTQNKGKKITPQWGTSMEREGMGTRSAREVRVIMQ